MIRQNPSAGEAPGQSVSVGRVAALQCQRARPVRTACRVGTLLVLLAACGDDDPPEPVRTDPATIPVQSFGTHGHFRGTASSKTDALHAEAVITVDGMIRLTIGGRQAGAAIAAGAGLTGELLEPESSLQFFGHVQSTGVESTGEGTIVSESCDGSSSIRFCDAGVPAVIRLGPAERSSGISGGLRVADAFDKEAWFLELSAWSAEYFQQGLNNLPVGVFEIQFAKFSRSAETVLTVFDDGSIFYQSPGSGCVGNGTLVPHLDGAYRVFDVSMSISNCNNGFEYLNLEYTGLATRTSDGYFDAENWLLIQVSTPDDLGPAAAFTIFANDK